MAELRNHNYQPLSHYKCPQCYGEILEDNFPPNYGRSVSTITNDGKIKSRSSGSIKAVCTKCLIHFVIVWEGVDNNTTDEIREVTPLVEMDGELLTPYDVWQEEYKAEHGQYLFLAFG